MDRKFESEKSRRESEIKKKNLETDGDSLYKIEEEPREESNQKKSKSRERKNKKILKKKIIKEEVRSKENEERKKTKERFTTEKIIVPIEKDIIIKELKQEAKFFLDEYQSYMFGKLEDPDFLAKSRSNFLVSRNLKEIDPDKFVEQKKDQFLRVIHRVTVHCEEIFRKMDQVTQVDPDYEYPVETVTEPFDENLRDQKAKLYAENAEMIETLVDKVALATMKCRGDMDRALRERILEPGQSQEDLKKLRIGFKGKEKTFEEFLDVFVEREKSLFHYVDSSIMELYEEVERRKKNVQKRTMEEFQKTLELKELVDFLKENKEELEWQRDLVVESDDSEEEIFSFENDQQLGFL